MIEIVQKSPIYIRITHHGNQFSGITETRFVARNIERDLAKIPELVVEMWPPHSDRVTDSLRIWKNVWKLRQYLAGSRPGPCNVSFLFMGSDMTSWPCEYNTTFRKDGQSLGLFQILDFFSHFTLQNAFFYMPIELVEWPNDDIVCRRIDKTNARRMGQPSPNLSALNEDCSP